MKKILIFMLLSMFTTKCYAMNISAKSAILYEPVTKSVLYEKNADARLPIASTTKIATAITALENSNLGEMVTVSKKADMVEGSSIWLSEGEHITMNDLLYGLMLSSGNDAAIAIAEHISGDTDKFALLMNETAKKAGCKNTNFKNPNGLDEEGHYTTARDLAVLTAYAYNNPTFCEIVSTKKKSISWENHDWGRTLKNHNKLLSYYDGANGVKTGFTKKSGRCLVSGAQREGIQLICVTINAPSDWDDHKKLLDFGFEQFRPKVLCNYALAAVSVKGGSKEKVNVEFKSNFVLPQKSNEKAKVEINMSKHIEAPVKKGQVLGVATIYSDSNIVGKIDIVASEEIKSIYKPNVWDNFSLLLHNILC